MKVLYFWINFLVIVALIFCYYLIPTNTDIAFMAMRAGDFIKASQLYLQEYNHGNRSVDVVVPLAKVEVELGHLNKAIAILEQYVKEHPSQIQLLILLSQTYKANQQYELYYQTLVKLHELHVNGEITQELASEHHLNNEMLSYCSTLEELVPGKQSDSSHYLNLALCFLEQKNYEKASLVLKEKRLKFPKDLILNDIILESSTLMDQGKNDEAIQLLSSYLMEKKKVQDVYYVLGLFEEKYPQLAPELIHQLDPIIAKNPLLETQALQFLWEKSKGAKKELIYQKLMALYRKETPNTQLQNLLFNIFLDRKEDALLMELIEHSSKDNLEEDSLLNLVYSSIIRNQPQLAIQTVQALGEEYLKNHKVVAVALFIASGDKGAYQEFNKLISHTSLTQSERYKLFAISTAKKWEKEALKLGAQLQPFYAMNETQLIDIAYNYIRMKKGDEFYVMLQKSQEHIGKETTDSLIALLNASNGKTKETLAWLSQKKNVSETFLNTLFLVADESLEYSLAVSVAQRLRIEYPSPQADAYYGLALVHIGEIDEGLGLLKTAYEKEHDNKNIELNYFSALVSAVKQDKHYRKDLANMMEQRKSEGPLSDDLLQNFTYAYLEQLNDIPKAISGFWKLADKASVQSDIVQTLVYLLGPRPLQEDIEWFAQRALQSSTEDFGYWLENLVSMGSYCLVIDLFCKRLQKENDYGKLAKNAYFAYMNSLAFEKKKCDLRYILNIVFCLLKDIKDFEKLSPYAEEAEYLNMRQKIWEKIVCEKPYDGHAWQELSRAYFDRHNYCAAADALHHFFAITPSEKNPKLYQSFYEYGLFLERRHFYLLSKQFYKLSLSDIQSQSTKTPAMVETEAVLLYQLNFKKLALFPIEKFYEMTSRDPDSAAAFANMLMDQGYLEKTRYFLRHEPECETECIEK